MCETLPNPQPLQMLLTMRSTPASSSSKKVPALSQLKQWKARMSEPERDVLPRIGVIGARQFKQGWISILLDVKQNSRSIAGIIFPLSQIESVRAISQWILKGRKRASRQISQARRFLISSTRLSSALIWHERFCREGGTYSKTIQTRKTNGDAMSPIRAR
jgi:hypothetical protein